MKSVRLEIAEAIEGHLFWRMSVDNQAPLSGLCEVQSPNDKARLILAATEALQHYEPIQPTETVLFKQTSSESHLDDWMKPHGN